MGERELLEFYCSPVKEGEAEKREGGKRKGERCRKDRRGEERGRGKAQYMLTLVREWETHLNSLLDLCLLLEPDQTTESLQGPGKNREGEQRPLLRVSGSREGEN